MSSSRFILVVCDRPENPFHVAYIGDDAGRAVVVFEAEAQNEENASVRRFNYPLYSQIVTPAVTAADAAADPLRALTGARNRVDAATTLHRQAAEGLERAKQSAKERAKAAEAATSQFSARKISEIQHSQALRDSENAALRVKALTEAHDNAARELEQAKDALAAFEAAPNDSAAAAAAEKEISEAETATAADSSLTDQGDASEPNVSKSRKPRAK